MNGDEKPYSTAFSHMTGVGPLAYTALTRHFGTAQAAYRAGRSELRDVIGLHKSDLVLAFRAANDPYELYDSICRRGIYVISRSDPSYPARLLTIADPPICLYCIGDPKRIDLEKDFLFAVVGTRRPSSYGRGAAARLAGDLTRAGMVIVSGMAQGIDTAAHKACLARGGRTVIVLGSGVDIVYPALNRRLYHEVADGGGLIISEFPPGMRADKGLFVSRNRIIAGISRGLLVVEGAERSGALISAHCALDGGREVFAVPGLITSDLSRAPHMLINAGARLATSANDILEEFNLKPLPKVSMEIPPDLSQEERAVYQLLLRQSMLIDDIVTESGLPVSLVLTALSTLEIKGFVGAGDGAEYCALSLAS